MTNYQILSETRTIQNITRIRVNDYGLLIINQGEEEKLVIEGTEPVIRNVKTEAINGLLTIDLKGGFLDKTWQAFTSAVEGRSLNYILTIKNIEEVFVTGAVRVKSKDLNFANLKLTLKGAGEIIISNISGNRLDVELPGAGIISLSGKVIEQDINLKGAGSYDAPRLESQVCRARLQGVGRATVWAARQLDAKVDGVGSIDYYGDPDARKSISGLGRINHRIH